MLDMSALFLRCALMCFSEECVDFAVGVCAISCFHVLWFNEVIVMKMMICYAGLAIS